MAQPRRCFTHFHAADAARCSLHTQTLLLQRTRLRHWRLFCIGAPSLRPYRRYTRSGRTVTHLPHVFVAVVSEVQLVGCYNFIASAVIIIWVYWAQNKGNQGHCDIMVMLWWPKWRKGSSSVRRHSYIRHLLLKSNRFPVSTSRTAFDPTLSPDCIHSAG